MTVFIFVLCFIFQKNVQNVSNRLWSIHVICSQFMVTLREAITLFYWEIPSKMYQFGRLKAKLFRLILCCAQILHKVWVGAYSENL